MKSFEADWICPASSDPIRNGGLTVSGERILSVGPRGSGTAGEVERFPGCAIIPGFVNAHTHLELTVLRGFLENLDFVPWVRALVEAKYQRLTDEDLLLSARLGAAECLQAGVTAVGEIMDLGAGWRAMKESGLQGIAFQEVFGPAGAQAETALDGLRSKLDALRPEQTSSQRLGVSPHAPYTVSARLYRLAADWARGQGYPLAMHIAESSSEREFVMNASGPFADALRSRGIEVQRTGLTPIEFLATLDLIRTDCLLIHAVDAGEAELNILERSGPRIVHCPKSNAKFGHGIARVSEFLKRGLSVGLGTDSVASNNAVDMFEEMRMAVFLQRLQNKQVTTLTAREAFRLATMGGAECLGLENEIGSLEAGKRADFVVVRINDLPLAPVYDPIETMVFSGSRAHIEATYLGGVRVECRTETLLAEAQRIAQRLSA